MSKSPRPTYSVEVRFTVLGEVEVDNDVNGLDIDTTGEEVRADKVPADAIAEIVEDAVAVGLEHFRMGVKAGVAKFCDFFGQEFDAVGAIAENNGLIDLELKDD